VSTFGRYVRQKDDTVDARGGSGAAGAGGAPEEGGDARASILHRIRSALADAEPGDIPRNYRTEDERERDEIVNTFAERVAEYRATVHRVGDSGNGSGVGELVARIAEEAGARRMGVPPDLPSEWRPEDIECVEDASLSVHELDQLDGALTGCALGIAEVGAFVLDAGAGQGRRALSLVPDLHICVVREDQVVGLVPEAIRKLEESVKAGRPLTFVAGPSATSDIELDRVEGVHGPRQLHVIVVGT
jgi:L-lactate dehydrogenase complex protein LldG